MKTKDTGWLGEVTCVHNGGIESTKEKRCCGGVTVVRFVACKSKNLPLNADSCCRRQICRQYEGKEIGNEN